MQPLQICICPTIRIGREGWCLPYAGFFFYILQMMPILTNMRPFPKDLTNNERLRCGLIEPNTDNRMGKFII